MKCANGQRFCTQSIVCTLAGWFLLAVFVGEIELLTLVPAVIPAIVLGLTGLLMLTYWRSIALREALERFDLRIFILLHLTRFVGIYFLVLHGRGLLPRNFAVAAGWGDIAVASGAVAILRFWNRIGSPTRRAIVMGWSLLGLIDIFAVVVIAGMQVLTNAQSMAVMMRLPLSLLPTMIVPLIIFSHVVILARLRRREEIISKDERNEAIASL